MFGIKIESSKYRFYVIIVLFLLAGVIAYKVALGETINLMSTNDRLLKKIDELRTKSITPPQDKTSTFKECILIADSTLDSKNKLFRTIENISTKYNVELIEFQSLNDITIKDGVIVTQQLKLSGDYTALLRSLNVIEKIETNYKLNSIKLIKTRNTKTKNDELLLELLFQAFVKG